MIKNKSPRNIAVTQMIPKPVYLNLKTRDDADSSFHEGLELVDITDGKNAKSGIALDTAESGNVWVDTDESHNLIIGSTGCGKSRRCLIESLLTILGTDDNAVIYDPKGEMYRLTSGLFEENGYTVHVLDGRRGAESESWNVFKYPFELMHGFSEGGMDRALEILLSIAQLISPVTCPDPYWETSAQYAIYGAAVGVMKKASDYRQVTFEKILKRINWHFSEDATVHHLLNQIDEDDIEYTMMAPLLENADNTRKCIISMIRHHLNPYVQSDTMKSLLSNSDIEFKEFLKGKIIVYLISPDESDVFNPIISIFVKSLYDYLVDKAYERGGTLRKRTNFILDEFAALPRIDRMPHIMSAARSRNIRLTLAVQSLKQLDSVYGKDAEAIKGNCSNWVFFSSRDLMTLREISELAGVDENGKRRYSTSDLQLFDKLSGEILVFRDRKKPKICHLRDISEFKHFMDGLEYESEADIEEMNGTEVDIEYQPEESFIDKEGNIELYFGLISAIDVKMYAKGQTNELSKLAREGLWLISNKFKDGTDPEYVYNIIEAFVCGSSLAMFKKGVLHILKEGEGFDQVIDVMEKIRSDLKFMKV